MLAQENRKRSVRGRKYSKCGFLTAKMAGNSEDIDTLYSSLYNLMREDY